MNHWKIIGCNADVLTSLGSTARKTGLQINGGKTKYMTTDMRETGPNTQIGSYNFGKVISSKFLGSVVTADKNMNQKVTQRLIAANRCYYRLLKC